MGKKSYFFILFIFLIVTIQFLPYRLFVSSLQKGYPFIEKSLNIRNIGIKSGGNLCLKDVVIKLRKEIVFSCEKVDTNIKILDFFKSRYKRKGLVLNLVKPFIAIRPNSLFYVDPAIEGIFFIFDGTIGFRDEKRGIEFLFKRTEGEIKIDKGVGKGFIFSKHGKGYVCVRSELEKDSNVWRIQVVNYPIEGIGLKILGYRVVSGWVNGRIDFIDGKVKGKISIKDGVLELKNESLQEMKFSGILLLKGDKIFLQQGSVRIGDTVAKVKGVLTKGKIDLEVSWGEVTVLVFGTFNYPRFVYKRGEFRLDLFPNEISFTKEYISLKDVIGNIGYGKDFNLSVDIGEVRVYERKIIVKDAVCNECIKLNGYISRREYFVKCKFLESFGSNVPFLFCSVGAEGSILFWSNHRKSFGKGKIKTKFFGEIDLIQNGGKIFLSSTGGPISLKGEISIKESLELKVDGIISEMEFSQFIEIFGKKIKGLGGRVWGSYKVSGKLGDPDIFIKLRIEKGQILGKEFEIANLNLKGGWDKLDFYQSMIYNEDICAEVRGSLRMNRKDLFEGLKILPVGEKMFWQGINIYTDRFDDGIGICKDVGERVVVDIRSPSTNDPVGMEGDSTTEVQLRYKVGGDKNVLFKMEKGEGTVGIEHKMKF